MNETLGADWFQRHRLKLRHLGVLLAVARTRHIGRAAQALHTSQPAVSKAIQEIERAAGVALFAVHLQREEERQVAAHLELLLDYEAVSSLGDVESAEDAAVVAALDDVAPGVPEGRP